jgi:hypothetical protein
MAQKHTLRSLEARMDEQLHAFGYGPSEEEKRNGSGRLIGAAALGTAGAVGYAKRNEIKRGVRVGAYKGAEALGDASARLTKSSGLWGKNPQKGVGGFLKNTAATGAAVGARGLRKVSRMLSAEDMDFIVELAERVAMIELAVEEDIIEFEKDPNRQRGAIGTYMVGGPVALYDRKKYRESGLALRKRDAFKDNLKGSAAGAAATYGTVGAIGAGAYGLGRLAANRKLPKGMLRKAGVKAGQAYRKASPKLASGAIVASGLAGLGTSIKVQHGSAEKRRKKLLMDRLQGGE